MRLIIDIPEQWRDDMVWENFDKVDELCQAILDGDIIPDNATNGDVIKAMFPKAYIDESRYETPFIDVMYEGEVKSFSETWWNAPYQKGGKE